MSHRNRSVILLALARIYSLVHYLCSLLECKPCECSEDDVGKVHEVLLLAWTGQTCTGLLDLATGKEENNSEVKYV